MRKAARQGRVVTPHDAALTTECSQAEAAGFDVLLTTDQNLKYQQNLSERSLAIVVLLSTSWPKIQTKVSAVAKAVDEAKLGSYTEVMI